MKLTPISVISFITVAFLAGFVLAWQIKLANTEGAEEASVNKVRQSPRPRSTRRGTSDSKEVATSRYDKLLLSLQENRLKKDVFHASLSGVKPGEVPDLLQALAAKAGLNGLSSEDESLMENMVNWWYGEDPEAALSWVLNLDHDRDQAELLREILKTVTNKGMVEALAFLDDLRNRGAKCPGIPYKLLEKAGATDAETLMRVCKAGIHNKTNCSGFEVQYAKGFDFKLALDQLEKAEAALPEGHGFSTVPSNLVKEWAKRDPQAALDWVLLGKEVPFNEGIGEFIEGYRKVANDTEMGTVIASIHKERGNYKDAWEALSELESEGVVRAFLANAPESKTQNEHAGGLLRVSFKSGSSSTETRKILLEMMDAQSRYATFTQEGGISILSSSRKKELRPILERLGHGAEEVEQMLAGSPKK